MISALFTESVRRDPYPLYERIRSVSPVFRDPGTGAWILLDYDSVKRALNDHEAFSSAQVSPPPSRASRWMIFADPPRHSKLRSLISKAFTPRAVAALEPRIRALATAQIDGIPRDRPVDLCAALSVPLPVMVIAELLGAPVADWPRFKRWADVIMGIVFTLKGGPEADRAIDAFIVVHDEMQAYLAGLVEERRIRPTDDVLTRLVEAEVDGERLTADELLGFFQLLLLAGHETTTNLINNAMLCLVGAPDATAALRADPERIPRAIEEVLRHRSPVQAMFRVARHDVDLRGERVGAGSLVLAMIGAANRDPAVFADPDRFDPARDPNPHVAFGHGIHFCIGAPLSRLEARVTLGVLLERFPAFELASDAPWEPRAPFHVHGPSRLMMRF
jgi:cytochrome P450